MRTAPEGAARGLIAGHNPGLHKLALLPAEEDGALRTEPAGTFPTAGVAVLRFDGDCWNELEPAIAALARFVRPLDLDVATTPGGLGIAVLRR